MYDPSVSVFVREYRSRIVGVIGAVARPGFHALASMDNTILDALTLAGGITDKAAPRLFFLPVAPQAEGGGPVVPASPSSTIWGRDPIVIELFLARHRQCGEPEPARTARRLDFRSRARGGAGQGLG
jgi:hypothetical protein